MKKYYFRFRIMLFTLALGLASVFMSNGSLYLDEIPVNLPQAKSSSVFEILPKRIGRGLILSGMLAAGKMNMVVKVGCQVIEQMIGR